MKYLKLIIPAIILSVACQQEKTIQLTDLKFNQIERKAISLNKVDTVFSIFQNRVNNTIYRDTSFFIYDESGNLLGENHGKGFNNYSVKYEYDSLNWIKKKIVSSDLTSEYKCTYLFNSDSLVLYQFWTGLDSDTCIYKFDKNGNNIESFEYTNNSSGKGWPHLKKNEFNDQNILTSITENILMDKKSLQTQQSSLNMKIPVKYIRQIQGSNAT